MPAPTRHLDPELASWAWSSFRPASVSITPAALREREKRAVVRAIETEPNLNAAAERLNVSRKTLFNRMREYGLPPGQSGRPKEFAPHVGGGNAVVVVAGVAAIVGGFLVGRWWMRRPKQVMQGGVTADLRGLDVIRGR